MIKKIFYLSLITFQVVNVCAQVKITGKIVDETTENPVEYATVYLLDQNIGTITDNSGDFSIYVSDTSKVFYLRFSCIGYQSRQMSIREMLTSKHIALKPKEIELEEVAISAFSESKINDVLSKIVNRYRSCSLKKAVKIFCSVYSNEINHPLELIEAFYSGQISASSGVTNMELKNGRIGIDTTSHNLFFNLNTTDFLCKYGLFEKDTPHGFVASPLQTTTKKTLISII